MILKKSHKILIIVLVLALLIFLVAAAFYKYVYIDTSLTDIVKKYSQSYNIDKYLIFSIIKAESNFKKQVVSNKGAVGLMQILPSTAVFISELLDEKEFNLYDTETNIRYGSYYIKYLSDNLGSLDNMILSYNAGIGTVRGWLNNKKYSTNGKDIDNIPYLESKNYLKKIKYYQHSIQFYQL